MSPEVETAVADRKAAAAVSQSDAFSKTVFYTQELLTAHKTVASLKTAIDVYDGPAGKGYVVRAECVVDGTRWVKLLNVGPEVYRERGWLPCPTT